MRGSSAYRRRLRLPTVTARLRLTLLYTGMFLVLGTAALAATFLLTSGTTNVSVAAAGSRPGAGAVEVAPAPVAALAQRLRDLPGGASALVVQRNLVLQRLLAVSWVVLAITAVLSAVLGWFASGRVLRPLRVMTERTRTISAGNLGERLALTGPDDEFRRLGDTFDELLARLESAFDAQRRFVANASHELRTPLTVERTLLQVALADPDADAASLRATCEELLASGRDQEWLLESLLTLASSERGLDHRFPFDLATLAERALADAAPEITRRHLNVVTSLAAAPATGDPALAQRLVGNLVDNAARYNVTGGRIELRTETGGGRVALSVSNTGPLVSPDEVERLFEPFARLGSARIAAPDGHHGLGLSIVRAIAVAHDGSVMADPQPDGGLTVTVTLPAGSGRPRHGG